jgi:hypothetical protein
MLARMGIAGTQASPIDFSLCLKFVLDLDSRDNGLLCDLHEQRMKYRMIEDEVRTW